MTDETKAAPRKRRGPNPIMTITPDIALMRLKAMENPTIQGLGKLLRDEGHQISDQTLYHWSKKHGWVANMAEGMKQAYAGKTGRAEEVAAALIEQGKLYTADAITGINWVIVDRLKTAIPAIRVDTPEDADRMVGVVEKLMALTHAMRGLAIGQGTNGAVKGVNGEVVRLGDFSKKANGATNGANGHG